MGLAGADSRAVCGGGHLCGRQVRSFSAQNFFGRNSSASCVWSYEYAVFVEADCAWLSSVHILCGIVLLCALPFVVTLVLGICKLTAVYCVRCVDVTATTAFRDVTLDVLLYFRYRGSP